MPKSEKSEILGAEGGAPPNLLQCRVPCEKYLIWIISTKIFCRSDRNFGIEFHMSAFFTRNLEIVRKRSVFAPKKQGVLYSEV